MSNQYWSWILSIIGLVGFFLAGRKVWWAWYVNIANQILWFAYAFVTGQWGFFVASAAYTFVFTKNAIEWTKDHRDPFRNMDLNEYAYLQEALKSTAMTPNEAQAVSGKDPVLDSFDVFDIHANYPFRWTFTVDVLDFPNHIELQNFIEYKRRIWVESLPEEYKSNPHYSFSTFEGDDFTAPSKRKITFEVSR